MENHQLGQVLVLVTFVSLTGVPPATGGRSSAKQLLPANQCTLYQGGCKYQLMLASSSCHMSGDDPAVTTDNNVAGAELVDSQKKTEEQIKKLDALENKLIKMMEGLSIRSLRHIRQIKADLREMTASMNLLKMKSRGGKKNGHMTCPPDFIGVSTWPSCYRFSTFNASWHESREYCSAFGANLVALDTMKEAYILDFLIKSNPGRQAPHWHTFLSP